MYEIGQLCGYEYLDTYATKKLDVVSESIGPARIASVPGTARQRIPA